MTSGAFWGPDRIENSGRVLDWLRERYELHGGGADEPFFERMNRLVEAIESGS